MPHIYLRKLRFGSLPIPSHLTFTVLKQDMYVALLILDAIVKLT
jgi:hypothetical protein